MVRDASLVQDNMAALFTTPADPAQTDQKNGDSKVMKIQEFNALSPRERMAFSKAGGKLED